MACSATAPSLRDTPIGDTWTGSFDDDAELHNHHQHLLALDVRLDELRRSLAATASTSTRRPG